MCVCARALSHAVCVRACMLVCVNLINACICKPWHALLALSKRGATINPIIIKDSIAIIIMNQAGFHSGRGGARRAEGGISQTAPPAPHTVLRPGHSDTEME